MELQVELSDSGPYYKHRAFKVEGLGDCPIVGDTLIAHKANGEDRTYVVIVRFVDLEKNVVLIRCKR